MELDDLESYSYCDCDYAKSLEDHPDNYQPPKPEPPEPDSDILDPSPSSQ